jgi:hypothetical protein
MAPIAETGEHREVDEKYARQTETMETFSGQDDSSLVASQATFLVKRRLRRRHIADPIIFERECLLTSLGL